MRKLPTIRSIHAQLVQLLYPGSPGVQYFELFMCAARGPTTWSMTDKREPRYIELPANTIHVGI